MCNPFFFFTLYETAEGADIHQWRVKPVQTAARPKRSLWSTSWTVLCHDRWMSSSSSFFPLVCSIVYFILPGSPTETSFIRGIIFILLNCVFFQEQWDRGPHLFAIKSCAPKNIHNYKPRGGQYAGFITVAGDLPWHGFCKTIIITLINVSALNNVLSPVWRRWHKSLGHIAYPRYKLWKPRHRRCTFLRYLHSRIASLYWGSVSVGVSRSKQCNSLNSKQWLKKNGSNLPENYMTKWAECGTVGRCREKRYRKADVREGVRS